MNRSDLSALGEVVLWTSAIGGLVLLGVVAFVVALRWAFSVPLGGC